MWWAAALIAVSLVPAWRYLMRPRHSAEAYFSHLYAQLDRFQADEGDSPDSLG